MKRVFQLTILFIFYSTLLFAQWTGQSSGVTNDLYDIHFEDLNTGWAVGANGKILRTTNGGTNWTALTSGTTNQLNSVFFVSTTYGAVVGNGGLISVTLNGGGAWFPQTTGYTSDFFDIFFTNSMTAYMVGDLGRILKSTDGGLTWLTQTSGTTDPLWSVWFTDTNTGWAIGGSIAFGRSKILKTVDGGLNWVSQIEPTAKMFYDVTFGDNLNGWAVSETGTLIKTANGGTNWATQNSGTAVEWLYATYAINNQSAWVGGGGGYIASTTNGGTSWIQQASGITDAIRGMYFVDGNTGWAVGDGGKILKYTSAPPASITVTSPNGGENWQIGTSQNITWTSTGVTNAKLEYSINNGTSWTQIVASTAASAGSYSWTVPNSITTQALVRITDTSDNTVTDQSNAAFTIYQPTVTVTLPNGGENWKVGTNQNITWTSSNVTNVKLEYSINNGTNWTQIVASTAASAGSYSWTVPNSITTQALVRITDTSDNTVTDQSNAAFTIYQPTVTITSPNGGEVWGIGTNKNITWTSSAVANVKIEYSINNGVSWTTIIASTPAGAGTYNWLIPNTPPTTQGLVRISDAANAATNDVSNATFTIPAPTITVTSPNGGENWKVGTNQNITWTSSSVANVKIEYSTNNGTNWTQIVTSTAASAGSYSWTVPYEPSTNCKVRVSDAGDATLNDVSNNVFTISTPTITLTSPNGGEILRSQIIHRISWNSSHVEKVKIKYTTGGSNIHTIVDNYDASISYFDWEVPDLAGGSNFKIQIEDASNPNLRDMSDGYFTIRKPIIISSPAGNEIFQPQRTRTISWSNISNQKVKIEYQYYSSEWRLIAIGLDASLGSYDWLAPSEQGKYKIRITSVENPNIFSLSNEFKVGLLKLDFPNGTEKNEYGSRVEIRWSDSEDKGEDTRYLSGKIFEFSPDGGVNWSKITEEPEWRWNAFNTTPKTTRYWIPLSYDYGALGKLNVVSTHCKLRIKDKDDEERIDESDAEFEIIRSKPIVLSFPSGGEIFTAGITWYIDILTRQDVKKVNIDLSSDSGNTWINIVRNFPTPQPVADPMNGLVHRFNWRIPKIYSSHCLIRVTDSENPINSDISTQTFTIQRPILEMVSPKNEEVIFRTDSIIQVKLVRRSSEVNFFTLSYPGLYPHGIEYAYLQTNFAFGGSENGDTLTLNLSNYSVIPANRFISIEARGRTTTLNQYFETGAFIIIKDTPFNILTLGNSGSIRVGKPIDIKWTLNDREIQKVKIELKYQLDNLSWQYLTIAENIDASSGIFTWNVPLSVLNQHNNGMIILTADIYQNYISKKGNLSFYQKELKIISPQSDERLVKQLPYSIRWTNIGVNQVNIIYSSDGGTSWNNIASNLTGSSGSTIWIPSNIPTANCKLKIVDASDNSEFYEVRLVLDNKLKPQIISTEWNNKPFNYTEGEAPKSIIGDLVLSDQADRIESATIKITKLDADSIKNRYQLQFPTTPKISGVYNTTMQQLVLKGTATINEYTIAIQNVKFSYTGDPHKLDGVVYNTLSLQVFDGIDSSSVITRPMTFTSVNSTPVISDNSGSILNYTIGEPPLKFVSGLSLNDDVNLRGKATLEVIISGNYVNGEDLIGAEASPSITSSFLVDQAKYKMIDNSAAPVALLNNAKTSLYYLVENGSKSIGKTKKLEIQYFDDYQAASNKLTKSVTIKAPTIVNPHLKPPADLKVEHASNGNIIVSWKDASGNAKGFIIYRTSTKLGKVASKNLFDNDIIGIVPASELKFIDKTNLEGFYYSYRVAAYNEVGTSDVASQPAVTINNVIKPPTNLSYKLVAYNTVELSWEDNSEIEQGFILESKHDTTSTFIEVFKKIRSTSVNINNIVYNRNYRFRIRAFNSSALSDPSNTVEIYLQLTDVEVLEFLPNEFALSQNYPNPFNPTTTISYEIPSGAYVTLKVYDVLGKEISSLVNEEKQPGKYKVEFDGSRLASGVYFYRLSTPKFTSVKKLLMMK